MSTCEVGSGGQLLEALRSFDDNPYISPSLYYMQLERYLQYFPSSQIP